MRRSVTGEHAPNNAEATRRFYDSVWPLRSVVLRTALILSGNEAEAEDLAQETLLRAFRGIGGFTPGTDAKAWLFTILRRTRVDRIRSTIHRDGAAVSLEALKAEPEGHVSAAPELLDVYHGWQGTADDLLASFSDAQVIHALQALPEEMRLTLLLVDVEQVMLEDAAQILGVAVGTVKSRTHRGRALLRQALLPLAREMRLVAE
jgi:RNA polymerase sigma-70 factor, ECF subfamily